MIGKWIIEHLKIPQPPDPKPDLSASKLIIADMVRAVEQSVIPVESEDPISRMIRGTDYEPRTRRRIERSSR
jgi:hypothetical protein